MIKPIIDGHTGKPLTREDYERNSMFAAEFKREREQQERTANPRVASYRLYREERGWRHCLGTFIGFKQAMRAWHEAAGGEANFEDPTLYIEETR